MVAIIKCTEEEQRHLTWLEELHNPRHQDEWVWNTTSTLPASPALEDHLINHDAETMMGWLSDQTQHVSWRIFRQYGQQLLVANANRTTAERTLGVDIIYYNVTKESLILDTI